ncbi:hypothetical protein BDD12DRAFT_861777 [Trichophaea hybrida]|nr:hypothetical protein BDD12DRAFT_861777 [Trichophaea hybrida]
MPKYMYMCVFSCLFYLAVDITLPVRCCRSVTIAPPSPPLFGGYGWWKRVSCIADEPVSAGFSWCRWRRGG